LSSIRVTYSGLIGLVIGLSTIITGLTFVIIVTRSLTQNELGTWSLIGALLSYVIISEPIISYWALRETARGSDSGKTAVVSSTIFSIGAIFVYLVITYFVGSKTDADLEILFFGALMLPFMFINRTLSAISRGWKPQVNSYGILVFDIVKIPGALVFIYFFELTVLGAILSLIVAYIASIIVLIILTRDKINSKIQFKYLKKWFKMAWLPSYIQFPNMVVLDVLIFSLITGSVFGLAYWTTAFTVGTLVKHSRQITGAVYPKLLEGGSKEYLQENLTRLFYVAFPMLALSIVFAKPILFALNPIYDVVVLVVVFITLRAFAKILADLFAQSLQGIEVVDVKADSTYMDYLKSKLFYVPTIRLIQRGIYLGTLAIGLTLMIQSNDSQLDLVILWSIIALAIQIPFTIYFYILVRKSFPMSINKLAIMKYLLISVIVFGTNYFLIEEFLEFNESIFKFLPNLLLFVVIGVVAYAILTYLTDKRTRSLYKAVIKEIIKK